MKIIMKSFSSLSINRTIDHAICTFNLPTEYYAAGQENILDEEEKVKIKVDPTRTSVESLTQKQLEDIVDGWMRFLTRSFRDVNDKVMIMLIVN
jgi:dynein heavy chain, axonemal